VEYAWIEKRRRSLPLPVLCEALSVSDSKHSLPVAGNVLDRQFAPDAPNRV